MQQRDTFCFAASWGIQSLAVATNFLSLRGSMLTQAVEVDFIVVDRPAEEEIAVDHPGEGKCEASPGSALVVHRFLAFLKIEHLIIKLKLLCDNRKPKPVHLVFYKQSMSFQRENLWKYDSEFDNTLLLNSHSVTVLFQPLVEYQEIKPIQSEATVNFMAAFAGGKECKNSLRLLSTEPLTATQAISNDSTLFFCTYEKNQRNNQKRFALLPYYQLQRKGEKTILGLDQPNRVLVVNNKLLVAIQKKCITLYRIQGDHLMVKDFDAIGIGNRLIIVDLQHVHYKGKEYLLIFGNQKEDVKPYFKCLVYELSQEKLKFIKKATLFERQTYKPIILFDKYPGSEYEGQKFCLVIGGFSDYEQQHFIFSGLQIHLHLLLEEWIEYSSRLTREVVLDCKHTVTSGKAIKVSTDMISDECWLLFCSEYQTASKLYLHFGQQKDQQFLLQELSISTKKISIRDQRTGSIEPINYAENTIYLMKTPEQQREVDKQIPYRVYWCDKKMERVRSRPLREFLTIFLDK